MLIVGAVVEGALKVAVLVDLKRRPKDQIRGRKAAWASALLVNSGGLIPLSYFIWGRRRPLPGLSFGFVESRSFTGSRSRA